MKKSIAISISLFAAACEASTPAPTAAPTAAQPLASSLAPAPAVPVSAPLLAPPGTRTSPVTAKIVSLSGAGASYTFRACETLLASILQGGAVVTGDKLAVGDVLVMRGIGEVVLKGEGSAVLATVRPPYCDAGQLVAEKRILRAAAAPELTWAGGKMHARLDVEREVSPNAYLGRLYGSAPVAEHVHPDSWEVICAKEAAGIFRLSGAEQRLSPGQCVFVPPGEKHAWTPDPGSTLSAVQMYAPPGPEQRFRALSADAGAAPAK